MAANTSRPVAITDGGLLVPSSGLGLALLLAPSPAKPLPGYQPLRCLLAGVGLAAPWAWWPLRLGPLRTLGGCWLALIWHPPPLELNLFQFSRIAEGLRFWSRLLVAELLWNLGEPLGWLDVPGCHCTSRSG